MAIEILSVGRKGNKVPPQYIEFETPTHMLFQCECCTASWIADKDSFFVERGEYWEAFFCPCPTCRMVVTKFWEPLNSATVDSITSFAFKGGHKFVYGIIERVETSTPPRKPLEVFITENTKTTEEVS